MRLFQIARYPYGPVYQPLERDLGLDKSHLIERNTAVLSANGPMPQSHNDFMIHAFWASREAGQPGHHRSRGNHQNMAWRLCRRGLHRCSRQHELRHRRSYYVRLQDRPGTRYACRIRCPSHRT